MPDSRVRLHIDDAIYDGWQQVSVTRSMEQMAGTFDLALTDRWMLDDQPLQIACGQTARVTIDDTTVLTGYVDEISASISADDHSLEVRGRDATGDLVDCSVLDATQEIAGRNLAQVATSVCQPFGVPVHVRTDIGSAFKTSHVQVGETAHELISRLARIRGVLCMSDGLGGLMIARASDTHTHRAIANNVIEGSAQNSQRDRFHRYRVLGQQRGTNLLTGEQAAQSQAEAIDTDISRYRPLVVQAEDQADTGDCQARAQWERSVRAGRANTANVTLLGWLDKDEPWQPNRLIQADNRALGLHGDYLITSVRFRTDAKDGQVTELSLTLPSAYALITHEEAAPSASGGLILDGLH